MMALVVLSPNSDAAVLSVHSNAVVISDVELEEIVTKINKQDVYAGKLEELLRTMILAYGAAAKKSPEAAAAFEPVVKWIQYHYIDLREQLPQDLKRLYLQEIAFRPQ